VVRFKLYLALAALVVAGCAANPEIESGASAALAGSATNAAPRAGAAVTPNLVVDVNDLAARAPAPVICRDMLKPNSNVITRQCMTEADWKRYKIAEAANAAEIVRTLQGGAYR
jgi:hypothetical protein